MKNLFVTILFITVSTLSLQAQSDTKNTIGIHGVLGNGYSTEISYQRKLFKNNRIETDFGFSPSESEDIYEFTGIYQRVWKYKSGFGFFAGAGGGIIYYDNSSVSYSGTLGKICGDVGLEYNFEIPLQIALDLRPEVYFNSNEFSDQFQNKLGLAVRYRF